MTRKSITASTTFADRLAAGPPTLRVVDKRAAVGDLVYSRILGAIFEVTQVNPAIVGKVGYLATRVPDGEPVRLSFRSASALTQAEAKEAREYFSQARDGAEGR